MSQRNRILGSLLAGGLLLVVAPGAGAATVTLQDRIAVFTAGPGEANQLVVELISPTYRSMTFFDPGAVIKAGPGCVAAKHFAICGATERTGHRVLFGKVITGDRDDAITVTAGTAVIDAGDGNDRVQLHGADFDSSVNGGPGADELRGGPGNEDLDGGPGDDVISQGDGFGWLRGGSGDDQLFGGPGFDQLDGGPGADTISGGESNYIGDGVIYETRTAPLDVTLDGVANDGEAGEHDNVMQDVETIVGGAGSDRLVGDQTDPTEPWDDFYGLDGRGGDDLLIGGPASETIVGWDGNDTLIGNGGVDHMVGFAGDDTIYARDGIAETTLDCREGSDTAQIDTGLDYADSCETLLP